MQPGAGWSRLYDQEVAITPSSDSFNLRFSELTEGSETRPRDTALRAFDIALSAFFLLVTLPVTLPITLVLLATSGRPLFYRGERVGRGGHVFEMLKFRTLRRNAEERLGPYLGEELVHRTGEETTAIGGWLRATQLDEIPQLWNVVLGDMSLVGPRPGSPRCVAATRPRWRRSSRTTSSGSPIGRCACICAHSPPRRGACCASSRAVCQDGAN
jgi:lipopolysaccharide/colanic/teichoic acid biosynthesis glycosyltransferase